MASNAVIYMGGNVCFSVHEFQGGLAEPALLFLYSNSLH